MHETWEKKDTKNPAVGDEAFKDGLGSENNVQTKRMGKKEKRKEMENPGYLVH